MHPLHNHSDVLGMPVQDIELGDLRRYFFATHCAMLHFRLITDGLVAEMSDRLLPIVSLV